MSALNVKFVNILVKIWARVMNSYQRKEASNAFGFIFQYSLQKFKKQQELKIKQKEYEEFKMQYNTKVKSAVFILNIVMKQVSQKLMFQSYVQINKHWIEHKLEATDRANQTSLTEKPYSHDHVELDSFQMNKYKLLKMLQSSVRLKLQIYRISTSK